MAETFEKFKNKVNKGFVTVSSKTSSTIEKSKLKAKITALQNDIEMLYAGLGQQTYEMWTADDKDYTKLDEKCNLLKEKFGEIDAINEEIRQVEEKERQAIEAAEKRDECPEAGNGCGNGESATEGFKMFCTSCGAEYDHPVKFCCKCGTKLEN